ncbi:MAG: hypothetical protein FJ088_11705, partial [Deltaproteobacteria bacterium]|nr:hypothetical protein [Deltaproteobacteria bacterium]
EQPSGDAGDVGRINTRVSLIENCFRSGVSWRGFASRFFNVWGDIDHFGLTAAIGNYEKINFVAHASRECTYAATFLTKSLKSGTSPWKAVHFFKSIEFDNVFFTDINDSTIIGGGEERLEEALGSARDASPERETVVIGNCDYYMIGDNIGSVCRRCAPASGGKITHLNPPLPGFHEVNSSNWWRDFLNSVDFSGEKGDYSVNLAGFGSYDDPGVMELTFLLNRVGIEVKSVILPNISPAARDNFGKAGITVLFPWHPVIETLARPLGEKGMRTISPAAPYGIKGTIEWLNTVKKATAEAAGGESFRRLTDSAEPVSDDLLKELAGEFAPGFCERRESAKGINIGLVCDAGTVGELLSPGFFFGFDPRGFFNELGFGLKIFVPPEIRSRGLPENSKRLFPDVDVVCFDDGDSYRELFHEHDARIVYCDVCGGRTVKEAGAVPFGVDSLEIGLSGAMSTLRKLLSLSKINIYSRYGALRS